MNVATLIPPPGKETPRHDCVVTTCEAKKNQKYLTDVPLPVPDLELCGDNSSYYLKSDQVTGYSVTAENKVVEASPFGLKLSAQAAELIVLTNTCQLSKEKTLNIYIDS